MVKVLIEPCYCLYIIILIPENWWLCFIVLRTTAKLIIHASEATISNFEKSEKYIFHGFWEEYIFILETIEEF